MNAIIYLKNINHTLFSFLFLEIIMNEQGMRISSDRTQIEVSLN